MPTTLLLCTDGSELALEALSRGLAITRRHDRVVVATVVRSTHDIDVLGTGMAGGLVPPEQAARDDEQLQAEGAAVIQDTCRQLGLDGAETVVLTGSAGPALCDLASSLPATAIVVGTRGRGGLARAVLGSVSDHVVRNAPCPVVVCPPR